MRVKNTQDHIQRHNSNQTTNPHQGGTVHLYQVQSEQKS